LRRHPPRHRRNRGGQRRPARRTEHQASSIAETSRTLNEFSGTVRVTADNARQTSSRLAVARNTAEAADQQAEQAVHGLQAIEASSREMAEIVGVIDGIAFQTNLLALNAGVEAARAAMRARALPWSPTKCAPLPSAAPMRPRTSRADHHIERTGIDRRGAGQRQRRCAASDRGRSFADFRTGRTDRRSRPAQSSNVEEISAMVTSMDQFTQQNASMVEQSTASTHSLSGETQGLVEKLRRFQMTRNMARPAEIAPPVTRMPGGNSDLRCRHFLRVARLPRPRPWGDGIENRG
jgi:methyl-accepting chemotaxis protein